MSRKTMRGPDRVANPQTLKKRIEKSLQEGQYRSALEQARALHERAPEPPHRELLLRSSFELADQLLSENHPAEATTIVNKIAMLATGPAEKERLAEILARSGNLSRAWLLAQEAGEPALTARILGHAADNAVRNLPTLTDCVPADFLAHRDAVRQAFAQAQAGDDEAARATLQVIGLTSPFLDWKLLLRGFLAYYQNEDAKAVENWQRLSPKRVPARLVAPFLASIDPGFRDRQSKETLERLQTLLERAQGVGVASSLRQLRKHLANEEELARAFRLAEELLPKLKAEAPQLVTRLANCFFWAIVDHGMPEDQKRFIKVFGAPPEDPKLFRMEALALEGRQVPEDAHAAWHEYEESLAAHAGSLPPGHADRMRALVWQRMGAAAASVPDLGPMFKGRRSRMPFGMFDDLPRPLKPDAETCFKKSVELAPNLLEAHRIYIGHLLNTKKRAKALTAVKKMLKVFPDRAQTLELAGDLSQEKNKFADAIGYYTRAVQANPIDVKLRRKLALTHVLIAETHAAVRQMDKARPEFELALSLSDSADQTAVVCPWAASEFRAGNDARAEELLAQIKNGRSEPLSIAFLMLGYAIRLKLLKKVKSRFEREFNALLKEPPTGQTVAAVADTVSTLSKGGIDYPGLKPQLRKVLAFIDRAAHVEFSETQLQQICDALVHLDAKKSLPKYFMLGQKGFPKNPLFFLAEVDFQLSQKSCRINAARVREALEKVRELAAALPSSDRDGLLNQVRDRDEKVKDMDPFGFLLEQGGMANAFSEMFGDAFGDDDDDDDYPFDDDDDF